MTTQLHCATCHDMFEVSSEIAKAMHRGARNPVNLSLVEHVPVLRRSANKKTRGKQDASETLDVDNSETRNIYILTPVGWKHLETDEVVKRCGIPL